MVSLICHRSDFLRSRRSFKHFAYSYLCNFFFAYTVVNVTKKNLYNFIRQNITIFILYKNVLGKNYSQCMVTVSNIQLYNSRLDFFLFNFFFVVSGKNAQKCFVLCTLLCIKDNLHSTQRYCVYRPYYCSSVSVSVA